MFDREGFHADVRQLVATVFCVGVIGTTRRHRAYDGDRRPRDDEI